ncbi:MAG: hypothetical protein ACLFV6_02605 [Spirulinaceae cyanobacterium]
MGHAVAGWLFGYPSIPSFDFMFGGGVTLRSDQARGLIIIIYFAIAWLFYLYRHNPFTIKFCLALTAIYTFCLITNWHTIFIIFMGHGCELIFAGIFGYRAMSGYGCRYDIERLLYAMLSFFTFLTNLELAWLVIFNPQMRSLYMMGKGGLIDSDFVRLARDYFGIGLTAMMVYFALICGVSMIATWGVYRYRRVWQFGLLRLIERNPL